MTIRRRILVVAMPIVALSLSSCARSDGPPLYPVHGKVMYKGQPAAGATVILRRLDPELNTTPPVAAGQVDDEGRFSVAVDERGEGAPAGRYAVLIQWRKKVEGGEEPKPAAKKGRRFVVPDKPELIPDRLEGRYMNPDRSPFRVEVKPGENDLEPFDVSKEPPLPAAARRPNQSVSD
jgi:hypothetical protein